MHVTVDIHGSLFIQCIRSFIRSLLQQVSAVCSLCARPGAKFWEQESEGTDNAPWPQGISIFTEVKITSLSIKMTQILFINTQTNIHLCTGKFILEVTENLYLVF